jgi:hypothetical protein
MGHAPFAAPWPMLYPRGRPHSGTAMIARKLRNPSTRRTAMRRRASQNTAVACAPWHVPWRDALRPQPRSYGAPAAPSGVPSLTMAGRLGRRPVGHAMLAAPPSRNAWSGGQKGGLAQGPRAPADDPAAWAGRDRFPLARRAGGLWLGPSCCAPLASCPPSSRGRRAAAAARAARGQGATASPSWAPRTRGRALSASQPALLARPVARLECSRAAPDQ